MNTQQELTAQISKTDAEILALFKRRMELTDLLTQTGGAGALHVLNSPEHEGVLRAALSELPDDLKIRGLILTDLLNESARIRSKSPIHNSRTQEQKGGSQHLEAELPSIFPRNAPVACQGVEGAFSQIAAGRFFRRPHISYCKSFDDVFAAVEDGSAQFGVLPIENSTAGSVNRVYDLLMTHSAYIVRTTRVKVEHNLLVKPGCRKEEITDIFSHEQALNQCSEYLKTFSNVRIHAAENTAVAAAHVASSDNPGAAALSSLSCAELYGLNPLEKNIQDHKNNYTRFACITKDLKVYPGANKSSLMLTLNHRPGALYKLLATFFNFDVNLSKLESRPIPERDFEFMFYFDLDASVFDQDFPMLLAAIEDFCEDWWFLGSYSEVI